MNSFLNSLTVVAKKNVAANKSSCSLAGSGAAAASSPIPDDHAIDTANRPPHSVKATDRANAASQKNGIITVIAPFPFPVGG
jgi:hypothetical protein